MKAFFSYLVSSFSSNNLYKTKKERSFHSFLIFLLAESLLFGCQDISSAKKSIKLIAEKNGLVSFWDFQSDKKSTFPAIGIEPASLLSGNEKVIIHENGGIFGRNSIEIKEGGWMYIPREKIGKLNIFGNDAKLTVIAWVKRLSDKPWQAIAGVWDESRSKRQYYLFMNAHSMTNYHTMKRVECVNRIHGHISATGGVTPGEKAWISYATGGTEVPGNEWHMITLSYDGSYIKIYLDDKLDKAVASNPFPYDEGIYNGGETGADFTVGSNSVRGTMSNNFVGFLGGLAVFDRDLSITEISEIYHYTLED